MGLEQTAERVKQNCGAIIDALILPTHKDKVIGIPVIRGVVRYRKSRKAVAADRV